MRRPTPREWGRHGEPSEFDDNRWRAGSGRGGCHADRAWRPEWPRRWGSTQQWRNKKPHAGAAGRTRSGIVVCGLPVRALWPPSVLPRSTPCSADNVRALGRSHPGHVPDWRCGVASRATAATYEEFLTGNVPKDSFPPGAPTFAKFPRGNEPYTRADRNNRNSGKSFFRLVIVPLTYRAQPPLHLVRATCPPLTYRALARVRNAQRATRVCAPCAHALGYGTQRTGACAHAQPCVRTTCQTGPFSPARRAAFFLLRPESVFTACQFPLNYWLFLRGKNRNSRKNQQSPTRDFWKKNRFHCRAGGKRTNNRVFSVLSAKKAASFSEGPDFRRTAHQKGPTPPPYRRGAGPEGTQGRLLCVVGRP